jgi:hypothetical protein
MKNKIGFGLVLLYVYHSIPTTYMFPTSLKLAISCAQKKIKMLVAMLGQIAILNEL